MDQELSYGNDYKFIPATSINNGLGIEVLPDLYSYTVQIVNFCLVGHPETKDFVLIDAGMPGSAEEIIAATEERFGSDSRPKAIILTHGHFDHVGGIIELINHWNVPVYAHELELPYLKGEKSYPEPDPTVEGGLVAKLSPYFPSEPINLSDRVQALPADRKVPFMKGFHWIETPGHTPGHVSFFRGEDRALIVGDAFVNVKQEYLYKVFTQEQEISGPPRYLTPDWDTAYESVKKLAALEPSVAITGHGVPMEGGRLTNCLEKLVNDFYTIAVPKHGRYVKGTH